MLTLAFLVVNIDPSCDRADIWITDCALTRFLPFFEVFVSSIVTTLENLIGSASPCTIQVDRPRLALTAVVFAALG